MQEPQLTHHIQLEILRRMLTQRESRYSDLKPKQLEANLFVYHLKQLMRLGFVEKQEKVYLLTRAGKHFADRASLATMKIRLQPKIVIVLTVRRADGQWLLLTRKHQPFENYKGFPSGKLHYGETLAAAASRELTEKTQLQGIDLTLRGNLIMRFNDGNDIVNHLTSYVFYGEAPVEITVDYETEHFQAYFADEAQLFEEPCFEGHQEILNLLKNGSSPFVEEFTFPSAY